MSDDVARREALTAAIDARNPGAAPATPAEAEKPEPIQAEETEQDEEADEATESEESTGEGEQPQPGGRRKRRAQARINELVRERIAAQEEAKELRRQLEQRQSSEQAEDEAEKSLADFDWDEGKYREYLRKQGASEAIKQEKQRAETERKQQAQSRFLEKARVFSAANPNFETVAVKNPLGPYFTDTIIETIFESDVGPELAMYLGENLDKTEAILKLSPAQQARELGRIEARLERKAETPPAAPAQPPRRETRAPAIGATVSASSPGTKALADMTVEDHIAAIRVNKD